MENEAKKYFVSHATADDPFVTELRTRLEPYGLASWTDSRDLVAGDALQPTIEKAIEEADVFAVVLSGKTINSRRVTKEVDSAKDVKKKRADGYRIIPLLKDGIEPSALHHWFGEEPLAITIDDSPNALEKAMPEILAAFGLVLPIDKQPSVLKPERPVAELIVTLEDPTLYLEEGKTRAKATVTLTYVPPVSSGRRVESRRYGFIAPLGPIETGELTWYLENYYRWPTTVFLERAQRIEKQLPEWGKLLYDALHSAAAKEAFEAWEGVDKSAERRLTVKVERELPEGTPEETQQTADESATLLLALPWELLHNGKEYLFEAAKGVRVRRQLPNRIVQKEYDTRPPIRVLLVSPRPEEVTVGYIDHRISARPLVEALAPLGSLAEWTFLTPPTFDALKDELRRADESHTPYHVVHFDGHGVYDPRNGLGALVFENHEDREEVGPRRHTLIHAEEIANAVREYRVPLVFLEACQSAQSTKDPTASVAGKLLEGGVASVVAMTHSVLVETAKRFVEAFYREALRGERVGQAMLAGQRVLKADSRRGHTFAGELRLQDWFVPVLYQEERDPPLVREVPAEQVQEQTRKSRGLRLGRLPETPPQTFVGRSRELLRAERTLHRKPYVVIVGEGGEGKTTLACELARWLVETNRFERAAFVSLEQALTAEMVLSQIGDQLVPDYQSKAGQGGNRGWLEVERALKEQHTILVLDNLESVLKPPAGAPGEAAFEPKALEDILTLYRNLNAVRETRLVFTSRERLPEPFYQNTLTLGRLTLPDAIELVAKTLGDNERMPGTDTERASREEIERLVETVGGHARALVLIAREVARGGVRNATQHLDRLLHELEKEHPGERERSLLASVRLSLDRLPAEVRQILRPLGVFQGGASLIALAMALQIEDVEIVKALGSALVAVGVAEPQEHGYLRFDPALAAALLLEMDTAEQEAARERWAETMQNLAEILRRQQFSNPQFAHGLAMWEMPNLLAALEHRAKVATAEEVVQFATNVEPLAQQLGRVRVVAQTQGMRRKATEQLSTWSHAAFQSDAADVDHLLNTGRVSEAANAAERLQQRCETAGTMAYEEAAYDIAMSYWLLGRTRMSSGADQVALSDLQESERQFTTLVQTGHRNAERMASCARSLQAHCLTLLGRLDEAATLYARTIQDAEQRGDLRAAAAERGNLGTVYMSQKHYPAALEAYGQAREAFERLKEPQQVAGMWYQIGMIYSRTLNYRAAEHALQEALKLLHLTDNSTMQAACLLELGNLYVGMKHYEGAVRFFQEATNIFVETDDYVNECKARYGAAVPLIFLRRYDEARQELRRAIECIAHIGHSAQPWYAYDILHNLERAVGNEEAAQAARQQAMDLYRAYRQGGGENVDESRPLFETVQGTLTTEQKDILTEVFTSQLHSSDDPNARKPLFRALLRVLEGEDPAIVATDPELTYLDAVEVGYLSPNPHLPDTCA